LPESDARNAEAYTQVSFFNRLGDAIRSRREEIRLGSRPGIRKDALSDVPLVAIVDDDGPVRVTTDSFVRSLGYIVRTFSCAEELLRSSHLDEIACVIADVQMPGMNGVELQAHLRSKGSDLPFIFFTAFPDDRTRARALRAGAICYLTKPFDGDKLAAALRDVLKKQGGKART